MKNVDVLVDKITLALGLDDANIALRLETFEIGDADIDLLKRIHERLRPRRVELVERVHDYLLHFPLLQRLLGDPASIASLKQAQYSYFDRLTAGTYDADYVKHRLRVGAVHQLIGLEPRWYLGAYRKALSELAPLLAEVLQDEPDAVMPTYQAILKVVCFDVVLALDTYFEADRQAVVRVKEYSEQIIASMPSGLVVLDPSLHIRSINPSVCRMFGITDSSTIIGKEMRALVDDEALLGSLRGVLATGYWQHDLQVSVPGEEGSRHFEFDASRAMVGEDNALLVMVQDTSQRISSQEELRRFRMALDTSIDAVYLIDPIRMRFVDANATALATLGYCYDELMVLGPQDLKPDEGELERIRRRYREVTANASKTGVIETMHQRKDGTRFPVEVYLRAIESEGRLLLVAVVRDITERRAAEAVLRDSEERFRVAFNQAAVGLAHVAPDGYWLMVNDKLCEIVGYTRDEMLQLRFQDVTHPEDVVADWALARRMIAGEVDEKSREKRYRRKDGCYIWVNLTSSMVRDDKGVPKYYSTVVEDISRRKQMEEELLHLANHDALTGLPNRSLVLDRLTQSLGFAARANAQVAVMLIDLDRFKNINDSLGHGLGDQVIIEVARRLSLCRADGDTVARLGGDEFVLVCPDVREQSVALLAQQVLEALARTMTIQGHEFFPTGSIGISVYPRDGLDGQTLLRNADTAMYRAKDAGRANFQFYAHEMNARALDRLKLEGGLRRAIERNEFVLHYQPQMDIATGAIVGVEALVRWQPPDQDLVMPGDFIPIAEETGLIVPIGEWVLREACAQSKVWRERGGFAPVKVAVNLSARQFQQQDIVKMVSHVLAETECQAHWLALEITESVVMDNPAAAAETLRKLSRMGVHLSIDDFGTGYSSLNYLKRFPIDSLKIDRSFVRDITSNADDAAIATAVIALAQSLKLTVIAEGVETAEQLAFLQERNCDQMQGYFLSRPVSAPVLERLLVARGRADGG